MNNFDNYANENKTEHNSKWPYISDHPYRIIRLEVRKYNMTLIERPQKYHLYHQAKLISMNILLVKKYYLLINSK